MAQTPYHDLGSTDILSAYVSGLQHSVNKIEEVLGMKTQSAAGHKLAPVTDQDDPSMRYRIYEGSIRNWLDSPVPTVYRNGAEVDASEYDMSAAYGVVVFHEQQAPNDDITADFNYIIGSAVLQDTILNAGRAASPSIYDSGSYYSHFNPEFPYPSPGTSESVLVYGGYLDIFPMVLNDRTTFNQAAMQLGKYYNSTPDVNVKVGIYADNGGYPGDLLLESPEMSFHYGGSTYDGTANVVHEWQYADIDITLEPGRYWIARLNDAYSYWDGLAQGDTIWLRNYDATSDTLSYNNGYRKTGVSYAGGFPDPFPSGVSQFYRSDYASPWLIKA